MVNNREQELYNKITELYGKNLELLDEIEKYDKDSKKDKNIINKLNEKFRKNKYHIGELLQSHLNLKKEKENLKETIKRQKILENKGISFANKLIDENEKNKGEYYENMKKVFQQYFKEYAMAEEMKEIKI